MRKKLNRSAALAVCLALLVQADLLGESGAIPASTVKGKKLICITQKLNRIDVADLPAMVDIWQESGYDGVSLNIWADPLSSPGERKSMRYRWWLGEKLHYQEFTRDINILKKVKWGRLTDNLLWMTTFAIHKNPDWFDEKGWDILLQNARLAVKVIDEIGFKGLILDRESYSGDKLWDLATVRERTSRSKSDIVQKVMQRGRIWAKTLSDENPQIVLGFMTGYAPSWKDALHLQIADVHEVPGEGLWNAFLDGMVQGLGEQALLVNFDQMSYVDSQYRDIMARKDMCQQQSVVVSRVADLARRRISYSAGLWTDCGFGHTGRFSPTDVCVNHRDPERHKHATHNALVASDHYVWHWSEEGPEGSYSFLTTTPTPLMRQYWQANIDAHKPMDLDWKPGLCYDTTDYSHADAEAAKADAEFWKKMKNDGYRVVADLPEYWKFFLDTELFCRWFKYWGADCDDRSWLLLRPSRCWQSQGIRANDNALYRVTFDAPAGLDGEKQEIVLAFGHLGSGAKYAHLNGVYIDDLKQIIDVSKTLKPGEPNLVALLFMNLQGPGGLMGQVKLLVRDRKETP